MPDYFASVFPAARSVLGIRLVPLCVGHAALLQRLGSRFATSNPLEHDQAERGDLAEALLVLSRPWRSAVRLAERPILSRLLMWWFGRKLRTVSAHITATVDLSAHVAEAWSGPRVWLKGAASTQSPGEALAMILSVLKGSMCLSHDMAMDLHLNTAIWDVCYHLQNQGALELVDSGDDDLLAAAEKMRAELVEAHGA